MLSRRLLRSANMLSNIPAENYWLGGLEINHVLSPNGGNLAYWSSDNGVLSYDSQNDSLKVTRTASNTAASTITVRFTTGTNYRYILTAGQYIHAGAELKAPQDCRASIDVALYSTATGWTWLSGTTVRPTLQATQTQVWPLCSQVPHGQTNYYLEYSIQLLPPLDTNGTPVALPAGSSMTIRNTSLFVDQDPLDGLFSATSPGASWQGVANASPSVRRVATPKTHFTPSVVTKTLQDTDGPHLYKVAEVPTPPRAFTSTSVWNRPATTLVPIADSDTRLRALAAGLGATNNQISFTGQMETTWGVPTYYADASSPSYAVTYNPLYSSGEPPSWWNNVRIPLGARPADNDPTDLDDAELTIYDIERGVVMWFWKAVFDGTTWKAAAGSIAYLDGNGVASSLPAGDPRNTFNTHNGKNGHMVHARWAELAAGRFDRVIRIALPNYLGSTQCVWPLTYSDGLSTTPLAIPQGAILRLKSSINIDSFFPDAPPIGKIFLHQMQDYGLMYVDSGGDKPTIILEDTFFSMGLARWPAGFNPLANVRFADSGAANATTYFEICYPQP